MRHGRIAAARVTCNATRLLGNGLNLILRQTIRDDTRAVRAVWNTWVFQMETRVVADVDASPGWMASGINSELSVLRISSIGWRMNGSVISSI